MREEQAECHARVTGHVRGVAEMCSRDSATLYPTLTKTNGKNSCPKQNCHDQVGVDNHLLPTPGGRLKFFKDGKFILELSHRMDGDRTTWFPVPKKTFWPPASTTPHRHESSTSLSVSDDNSSVQSSPWQRDHCWKQAVPRRGISSQLSFYYRRYPKNRLPVHPRLLVKKRRNPHNPVSLTLNTDTNAVVSKVTRTMNGTLPGKTLAVVVDRLTRLLDPNVVSPRKRILRELERVTLGDHASKRRAAAQAPTIAAHPSSPKQLSSYSITSILGEDKPSAEPGFLRTLLRPEDKQVFKYSLSHTYPRLRMDSYVTPGGATQVNHPMYGISMLPPGPCRAPAWMPYVPPVHYPQPMPLYAPSLTRPPLSNVRRYKDYGEEPLSPSGAHFYSFYKKRNTLILFLTIICP
ncbi:uncharacterized protein LOC107223553 isoform X1 [Neodiprion lecontei]|uniref:Uncharacterized protein LOC107223553 isoform X1 n=1 Tax=Neodiprion lecontei TaxID=441921 RepID=A0ABM3GMY2_NEOLC|nr:uncharacterized protein LOC107223553 isoform X1 [Neodiprion lecontei]